MKTHFDPMLKKQVMHGHDLEDITNLSDLIKGFQGELDASIGTEEAPVAPPSIITSGWWLCTIEGWVDLNEVPTFFEVGDILVYTESTETYSRVNAKTSDAQVDITSIFDKLLTGLTSQKGVNDKLDELITEAAADPTVNSDAAHGYYKGCIWINGSKIFVCRDATTGAALWTDVTISGAEAAAAYRDFTTQGSVANPAAGVIRAWIETASGALKWQNSSGVIRGTGWTPALKGMTFDGVNDYIYAASPFGDVDLNTKNVSFEFYINPNTLFVSVLTPTTAGNNKLYVGYTGSILYFGKRQFNDGGTVYNRIVTIAITTPTHIVCVNSGDMTTAKIYVNGVEQTTSTSATPYIDAGTANQFNIGKIGAGTYRAFNCYSAKIYNRALSASEVLTMWNDGHPELYAVPYADKGGSQTATYTSDFSAGADSWTGVRGTLAGNIDAIAGVDNILRYYADTDNSSHFLTSTTYTSLLATKKYRVTLDYYLPSGQSAVDGFFVCARSSGYLKKLDGSNYTTINSVTDTWTTITIEVILPDSGIGIRQTSGGAGSFIGAGNVADDLIYIKNVVITQIGNVADYQGEWAGDLAWRDLSGNGLHGITSGSPVLAIPYPETQFVSTGNFVTDIASGTANKDITIPEGYYIDRISLRNTLSSGNITNFQAILDPAGDNITLLSGKTINNGKNVVFQIVADQSWNTAGRTVRFNATGNGAGGITIEFLIRRKY